MEEILQTNQEILDAIPHREPFLFVDEIVRCDESGILCKKTFTGREFFYQGHYPDYPITPGVLLCEAAMQAGAIFLSRFLNTSGGRESDVPVVGRMNEVKFKQIVRPGEEIQMHVTLKDRMKDVFFMSAKVTVREKTAVTFEFAAKKTPRI
ncbi:MAG: beta-hydroxyacyl-ACP dehydratase [Planctomycetaceae bacterium]|jgi:3-hydroxyacyl-[acyl-carrier-protein] dehydratase|nr:beta-hydroxyacyl-ACP dehydratase [Planctomycetaceae bacterium]